MRWGFLGQQLKTIKDNTTDCSALKHKRKMQNALDCSALNDERKMHKTLIYPR